MDISKNKWSKLLKWRWLFNWIPFVDFALVAGSMAMGEERDDSDFDIILGCEKGRIFTARIFTIALFGFTGKRRKSTDGKEESKDKFCFSHFVTPDGYTLRPPYNAYWQKLYQNLVPIYGNKEAIQKFFEANTWADREKVGGSTSPILNTPGRDAAERHRKSNLETSKKPNIFRWICEEILKTPLGDLMESMLKKYQLKRIKRKKPEGKNPRVYADETELELHPDTARIDEWIEKKLPRYHGW